MNKQKYTKPLIRFTSLAAGTSVSAGCELISNHAEQVCAVDIPEWGLTYFNIEGTCDVIPSEFLCYHVPIADSNVFSS